jgi:hypothetical protein
MLDKMHLTYNIIITKCKKTKGLGIGNQIFRELYTQRLGDTIHKGSQSGRPTSSKFKGRSSSLESLSISKEWK